LAYVFLRRIEFASKISVGSVGIGRLRPAVSNSKEGANFVLGLLRLGKH